MNITDIERYFPKPKQTKIVFFAEGITTSILYVDATINENHTLISEVTDHPIESGSKITDHIIKKPKEYTIEGVISDNPITLVGALAGSAAGLAAQKIGGTIKGRAGRIAAFAAIVGASKGSDYFLKKGQPSVTAFKAFNAIYEQKVKIDMILTGLTPYYDMVMTKLEMPRDKTTGHSLKFKAIFKHITEVTSQVGETALLEKEPKEEITKKTGDRESKIPDSKITDNSSLILKGIDGLKGLNVSQWFNN